MSSPSAPALLRLDGSPVRVLVVDDEANLTELLAMALRYEGWDVTASTSGRQAVRAAKDVQPDAVVLDMMLPDMSPSKPLWAPTAPSRRPPRAVDNVEGALRTRQESESRIRRFVADASHELRTPLASIRGYAELTRREREPGPPSVSHALGRVESEAVRLQGLVRTCCCSPSRQRTSARARIRRPHEARHQRGERRPCRGARSRVGLDLADEPVEVIGDEARLHQIVGNLLANARTHTPLGTTVVTGLCRDGPGFGSPSVKTARGSPPGSERGQIA